MYSPQSERSLPSPYLCLHLSSGKLTLWLTAPIIPLCLFGKFKMWLTLSSLDRGCHEGRGKGQDIKQKTKSSLHDNSPLPLPSSTPHTPTLHPPASTPSLPLLHPFPSAFHSCHSFFFSSTKSVLIANHHRPAKWQIILHSFITKPSSSYFVSQHVQYVRLPCLLI